MIKILWIICGILAFSGIFIILLASPAGNNLLSAAFSNSNKEVAGAESEMTLPDKEVITRPPIKSSSATDPTILSNSAFLIDVNTGYHMYEKNIDQKLPIASTTKIMTAIVVLENHSDKLNDVVTITYPMIAVEGSDIKLQVGEKIKVADLLKGLLIMSGNDTAYALAGYFGGKEAFVNEMNQKASYLGMKNTKYQDPSGLDDGGMSTAEDLAIAGTYAMRLDKFREIVKTAETSISSVDGRIVHDLKTSNHLLKIDDPYFYGYAIGIKTGFTYAAGHCLVSGAEKDNHFIISVVLNTTEDSIYASAKESRKLLDWGFNNWTWSN